METKERTERLLEESGRVTPRDVLGAYRATGLRPFATAYFVDDMACGLGAVCRRGGGGRTLADIYDLLAARLGDEERATLYEMGFSDGFEGDELEASYTGWARKGWRDGARCRKFVFGRPL